jgi:hypothetical protein
MYVPDKKAKLRVCNKLSPGPALDNCDLKRYKGLCSTCVRVHQPTVPR